jgi:uncharacterized protein (TIGR02996 family)
VKAQLDKASVTAAMAELGIEIDFAAFAAVVKKAAVFIGPDVIANALYKLAHEALHGPHGYAWAYSYGTMLVARDGQRVVFGVQHNTNAKRPFPPWGWKIERWSKNLEKNREKVAAWAKTENADVVAGTLVRPPARDDSPNAEGAALLAAIVANPDDSATRLVYADWLLERGDPRGELIRLHQEGRETGDLQRKHRPVLLAPYLAFDNGTRIDSGFIDHLHAFAGKLARCPEVFEREPFRALDLVAMKPDELAKLAKSCRAHLGRITELYLEGRKSPRHIARVPTKPAVIAPLLVGLRKLRIERLDETMPEWRAFFAGLQGPIAELEIEGVPRAVFDLIVNGLPALRHLHLGFQAWCNGRGRNEAVAVAKLLAKRDLASVSISSWHPGDAAMTDIVEALLAGTKTKIALRNCTMDPDTRHALSKRPRVTVTH